MSGLEIVAAIAGIISTFNGSLTLYRSWRNKRHKRRLSFLKKQKDQDGEMDLERSLSLGSTTIQEEYNLHFARLGQKFAIGDGQARAELSQYVIRLQHIIITLMNGGAVVLPSIPGLVTDSEGARTGTLRALGEQYQRMVQARGPVNSGLSSSRPRPGYAVAKNNESSSRGRAVARESAAEKKVSRSPGYAAVRPRRNEVKQDFVVRISPQETSDAHLTPTRRDIIEDKKGARPLSSWESCRGKMLMVESSDGKEISCGCCSLRDMFDGLSSIPIVDLKDLKRVAIAVSYLWQCHGDWFSEPSYACPVCDPRSHRYAKYSELETLVDHIGEEHTLEELENLIEERFMMRCTCTGKWSGIWTMEDEHSYQCPTRSLYWGNKSPYDSR